MTALRQSHPPTLLTLVARELSGPGLRGAAGAILVGTSGGPDSQALLHVLALLRPRFNHELWACGIDHGLRPEAGAELDLAEALCKSLGVPFERVAVGLKKGSNLMARAREARYAALQAAVTRVGATTLATAHHADDRAETVLLRLLRGTGPAGLAGFGVRTGNLIRPMLRARRSDVMRHLDRHSIAFAEDPTNRDVRHLRSAVRLEVLPMLERHSPRIVEHLCDLADDLSALGAEPAPGGLGRAHLQGIAQAVASGRAAMRISLPGNRVARVDSTTGDLIVEPIVGPKLQRDGGSPNHGAH